MSEIIVIVEPRIIDTDGTPLAGFVNYADGDRQITRLTFQNVERPVRGVDYSTEARSAENPDPYTMLATRAMDAAGYTFPYVLG